MVFVRHGVSMLLAKHARKGSKPEKVLGVFLVQGGGKRKHSAQHSSSRILHKRSKELYTGNSMSGPLVPGRPVLGARGNLIELIKPSCFAVRIETKTEAHLRPCRSPSLENKGRLCAGRSRRQIACAVQPRGCSKTPRRPSAHQYNQGATVLLKGKSRRAGLDS